MSDDAQRRRAATRASLFLLAIWLLGPGVFGAGLLVYAVAPDLPPPWFFYGSQACAGMAWLVLAFGGRHLRFPEFWLLLVYGLLAILALSGPGLLPGPLFLLLLAVILVTPFVSLVRLLERRPMTAS